MFNFHLDNLGIPRLPLVELLLKEEFTENKNKTVTKTNATDGTNYTESITESIPKVNNITYRLNIDKLDESYKSLLDRKEFYSESKSLLKKIKEREEEKQKVTQMKNKLESMIYRLKSEATDSNENKYLNATEREQFLEKSEEINQLLFEGEVANITKENVEILTMEGESLAHILQFRKVEHRERERVWTLWGQFLQNTTSALEQIKKDRPWTPEDAVTEMSQTIEKIKNEVLGLFNSQTSLPLDMDPVFVADNISNKAKSLSKQINKLGKFPKPKTATNKTANATAGLDDILKETIKKMQKNKTGEDMTDEQLEDFLKNYKSKMDEESEKKAEDLTKDTEEEMATKNEEEKEKTEDSKEQNEDEIDGL